MSSGTIVATAVRSPATIAGRPGVDLTSRSSRRGGSAGRCAGAGGGGVGGVLVTRAMSLDQDVAAKRKAPPEGEPFERPRRALRIAIDATVREWVVVLFHGDREDRKNVG